MNINKFIINKFIYIYSAMCRAGIGRRSSCRFVSKPLSFGIEKSTNFMLKRIFVSLGEGGAGVAAAEPSGGAARGAAGARPALALVDCRGAGAW